MTSSAPSALSRSPLAVAMVGELRRREIGFTSLHERLDTTTPGGRLIFHVFAALAEFSVISTLRDGVAVPQWGLAA
jgi:DNA invertase Pin-like site-specific DNA recombinase